MILMHHPAQTDEQAPLPGALSQLLMRVRTGLQSGRPADFVFNCQMGRGRTTSGMVTACLIATTMTWEHEKEESLQEDEDRSANALEQYDSIDGPSEEEAYLQGELFSVRRHCHRHRETLYASWLGGFRRLRTDSSAVVPFQRALTVSECVTSR